MSNNTAEKMITLRSSDEEVFEVPEVVGNMSQAIRHMIEDDCAQNIIPLPNISAKVLTKVIEYCKMHIPEEEGGARQTLLDRKSRILTENEIKKWDKDFVNVDNDTVFDLIWAANYLNIKGLLDLTCRKIADQLMGKSPEDMRKTFHIKNDYTPEEEAEVRKEVEWAFD